MRHDGAHHCDLEAIVRNSSLGGILCLRHYVSIGINRMTSVILGSDLNMHLNSVSITGLQRLVLVRLRALCILVHCQYRY